MAEQLKSPEPQPEGQPAAPQPAPVPPSGFWSKETLIARLSKDIIEPYDANRIADSSYELGVGTQAYISSNPLDTVEIPSDKNLVIPSGQFGLILTNEVVRVPLDSLAFISIKASIKFLGLINVSGFHVDPGYHGRLKFAVYNAGSQPVVLSRNQPAFMIWFAYLDRPTAVGRTKNSDDQYRITASDVRLIQGDIASPAQLKDEIKELRIEIDKQKHASDRFRNIIITIFVGILIFVLKSEYDSHVARSAAQATQSSSSAGS